MPPDLQERSHLLRRLPRGRTLVELRDLPKEQLLLGRGRDRALISVALAAMAADPANQQFVARGEAVIERLRVDPAATLDAADVAALEALALLMTRPAMFVRDGQLGPAPADWPEVTRPEVPARIRGVGRIEVSTRGTASTECAAAG